MSDSESSSSDSSVDMSRLLAPSSGPRAEVADDDETDDDVEELIVEEPLEEEEEEVSEVSEVSSSSCRASRLHGDGAHVVEEQEHTPKTFGEVCEEAPDAAVYIRACAVAVGADDAGLLSRVQSECWARRDVDEMLAASPTGSGKSLAFLMPILASGESAMVLSPTRELAEQTAALARRACGWNVVCVVGGVGFEFQKAELEAASSEKLLLIATPGRLSALLSESSISLNPRHHLVLDEADRLLDDAFAETVLPLVKQQDKKRLFTATLSPVLLDLAPRILASLDALKIVVVVSTTTTLPPGLTLVFEKIMALKGAQKKKAVDTWLTRQCSLKGAVVVFVPHKYEVKRVAALLEKSFQVSAVHGDLSQAARRKAMQRFAKTKGVLVATDLAARGLNLHVERVVSVGMGLTLAGWVHRVGRCARFGEEGTAITMLLDDSTAMIEGLLALCEKHEKTYFTPPQLRSELAGLASKTKNAPLKTQEEEDDEEDQFLQRKENRDKQRADHERKQQKAHGFLKKKQGGPNNKKKK